MNNFQIKRHMLYIY